MTECLAGFSWNLFLSTIAVFPLSSRSFSVQLCFVSQASIRPRIRRFPRQLLVLPLPLPLQPPFVGSRRSVPRHFRLGWLRSNWFRIFRSFSSASWLHSLSSPTLTHTRAQWQHGLDRCCSSDHSVLGMGSAELRVEIRAIQRKSALCCRGTIDAAVLRVQTTLYAPMGGGMKREEIQDRAPAGKWKAKNASSSNGQRRRPTPLNWTS